MEKNVETLNEMGREWYKLSYEKDGARKKALEEKIFLAIYDMVKEEALLDAVGEFFMQNWRDFDPDRMDLSAYVWKNLKFRKIDMFRKDNHVRRTAVKAAENGGEESNEGTPKTESKYDLSLDYVSGDGEEGGTLADTLSDEKSDMALMDVFFFDETLMQFLTLALNFSTRLKGKANNATKIQYYRMFFTDGVVNFVHGEKEPEVLDVCKSKERDIFSAMELPFLDFFETETCRNIDEVSYGRLKLYGALVDGCPMEGEVKMPLPNDVYMSYFERVEGKTVKKASSVSDQRATYRKFLREEVC